MPEIVHWDTTNENELYVFNTFKVSILKGYKVPPFAENKLRELNDYTMVVIASHFMWFELSGGDIVWTEYAMEIRYNPKTDVFTAKIEWIKFFDNQTEYELYRRNALLKAPVDGREIPPEMQN